MRQHDIFRRGAIKITSSLSTCGRENIEEILSLQKEQKQNLFLYSSSLRIFTMGASNALTKELPEK